MKIPPCTVKNTFKTAKSWVHGTGILIPRYELHPYYTPFFIKIQAKLANNGFFVNYDNFYVNILMSTAATKRRIVFIIFNYFDNILGIRLSICTKYCFCRISFITSCLGKFYLPSMQSAQLSDSGFVTPHGTSGPTYPVHEQCPSGTCRNHCKRYAYSLKMASIKQPTSSKQHQKEAERCG